MCHMNTVGPPVAGTHSIEWETDRHAENVIIVRQMLRDGLVLGVVRSQVGAVGLAQGLRKSP